MSMEIQGPNLHRPQSSFEAPVRGTDGNIIRIDQEAMDRVFASTIHSAHPSPSLLRRGWNLFVRTVDTICFIIKFIFEWIWQKVIKFFGCKEKEKPIELENAAEQLAEQLKGDIPDDEQVEEGEVEPKMDNLPSYIEPITDSHQPPAEQSVLNLVSQQSSSELPSAVLPSKPVSVNQPTPEERPANEPPSIPTLSQSSSSSSSSRQEDNRLAPTIQPTSSVLNSPKPQVRRPQQDFLKLKLGEHNFEPRHEQVIEKLVKTLSNKDTPYYSLTGLSFMGLLSIKGTLKQIHPLHFLGYILTSPNLRPMMKAMQNPKLSNVPTQGGRWMVFVVGTEDDPGLGKNLAKHITQHLAEKTMAKHLRSFARYIRLPVENVSQKMLKMLDELKELQEQYKSKKIKEEEYVKNEIKIYTTFLKWLIDECDKNVSTREHKE